jgi:hypothetical protein
MLIEDSGNEVVQPTCESLPVHNISDVKFAVIREMFSNLADDQKSFSLGEVTTAFIALRRTKPTFQFRSLAEIVSIHNRMSLGIKSSIKTKTKNHAAVAKR